MPAVLVWLVLAVLWSFFIHHVQPATTVSMTIRLWTRPLIAGDTVVFYLYKLGVPIWLGPDYGRSPDAVLAQSWLRLKGQTQEALRHYTEALRLDPDFAGAHNNLGATLADEGHIAEAIEHYTKALRLRPRYVNVHYHLGIALAK